jgi:diguanylate cyclase (GGDEF)-like protein
MHFAGAGKSCPASGERRSVGALKQRSRLEDILTAARIVVSQLDLEKALAVILRKALDVSGMKAGSIALYHPETNTLRIHAHKGFSRSFIASREWTVRPGGPTDRILRAKGVTVVNNKTNKSFFSNPLAVHERIKSLVCVPLINQKEPVGILYVDDFRHRTLGSEDLQELQILASFATIAIGNARAYGDIQQKAITDGLTGLFNRRYFETILAREFQRSKRHGREFTLALVDVDDFKKFNDRYGHQAGDAALAALGSSIRKAVRSTDLAARYGGDEMAVILPETKMEKAYNLFVKRFKKEVKSGFSDLSRGRSALTVTIGIASYPQDGKTARGLVLAADHALLDAKKHKRKRAIGCAHPVLGAV